MLVVGSAALPAQGIDTGRKSNDTDFIATWEEFESLAKSGAFSYYYPICKNKFIALSACDSSIEEYEIAWPGSTGEELLNFELGRSYASLEACLALKLSHRYLRNSPHFLKTMKDIWLLRAWGVTIHSGFLKDWLARREKETLNYGHPTLNQSKMGFFDASVPYKYDHDSIHKAVAFRDVPAYTKYKGDKQEVMCSKGKFFSLSLLEQLEGVAEEAYVLALERSLIPHLGALTPKQAFDKALMKVCTSITSGWFREFAWENYSLVQAIFNENYVDKFKIALFNGEIPLVDKKEVVA